MSTASDSHFGSDSSLSLDGPLVVLVFFMWIELVFPGFSTRFSGWPILLSLFVLGMPHGAIDFSVNSRMHHSSGLLQKVIAFGGYLAILSLSLICFLVFPIIAIVGFFTVTAVHFGLADARDLRRTQTGSTGPLTLALSAFARGTILVTLPFAVSPRESSDIFQRIVRLAGGAVPDISLTAVSTFAAVFVGMGLVAAAVSVIIRCYWQSDTTARRELLETAVIVAAFSVLNPLFVIGLYLVSWHSWRHFQMLRSSLEPLQDSHPQTKLVPALIQMHLLSLPLLIPTLLLFVLVAYWRVAVWSSESLAAVTIAFFVVVTLPHHFFVERFVGRSRRCDPEQRHPLMDLTLKKHPPHSANV